MADQSEPNPFATPPKELAQPDFNSLINTGEQDLNAFLRKRLQFYSLTDSYHENPLGALANTYLYEAIRQRSPNPDKLTVYYPGIGGGDQPFDILGAFISTDADEVFGVDMLDGREDIRDFHKWAERAGERLGEKGQMQITEDDEYWTATFNLYGKPRKLAVSKHPTDVSDRNPTPYVPPENTGAILYSRGTATLTNRMPEAANQQVRAIMVSDDYDRLTEDVQRHWQKRGFTNIDFNRLGSFLKETCGVDGDFQIRKTRLLVKP